MDRENFLIELSGVLGILSIIALTFLFPLPETVAPADGRYVVTTIKKISENYYELRLRDQQNVTYIAKLLIIHFIDSIPKVGDVILITSRCLSVGGPYPVIEISVRQGH